MTTADSGLTIELLLRHRDWVRQVARALVYGGQDADDLEQETWLAAVSAPPRDRAHPRGWLGTVLRRTASRVARADRKREAREHAAAPPDLVAPAADAVAEAEVHGNVVQALLRLAEPYRGTLLLRFFEDLSIREIAERFGCPIETVRTRLRRGIDLLRTALEERDPKGWRASLLPLAGAPAAKAGAGLAAGAGVLIMSNIKGAILVVTGACVIVAGVFFVSHRRDDPRPESRLERSDVAPPRSPSPTTTAAPASAEPIAHRPFVEAPATRRPAAPAPEPPTSPPAGAASVARLEVPIVESDGTPASARLFDLVVTTGVKTAQELAEENQWIAMSIGASVSGGRFPKPTVVKTWLDERGVAVCDVPAGLPGHLRVREAPIGNQGMRMFGEPIQWLALIPFDAVESGRARRLDPVTLPAIAVLVAGRVETDDGKLVAGATIEAALTGPAAEDKELMKATQFLGSRSGKDGRFRIESKATASGFVAFAHDEGRLASSIEPFVAGQRDLVLRVRPTGAIKGRVRAAPELPNETPGLTLEPESVDLPGYVFNDRWSPRPYIHAKKNGEFLQEGIPAGKYRLTVRISITVVKVIDGIVVEPGKTTEDPRFADLVVGEDLRNAVVKVVDGAGNPVVHATVYWLSGEKGGAVRGGNTSHTDAKGECTLPLPPDALMNIRVEQRGFRSWSRDRQKLPLTVTLDAGAKATITLPGSRDWAKPGEVGEYFLCLVPEADVSAARREQKTPIPARIHQSQGQTIRARSETYAFEGVDSGSYVVFVVPRKHVAGRTVTGGEFAMFYGEDGLELGRLELKADAPANVTYQVDVDRLIALGLR